MYVLGWWALLNKLINVNTISLLITLLVISIGYSAVEKEIKITNMNGMFYDSGVSSVTQI